MINNFNFQEFKQFLKIVVKVFKNGVEPLMMEYISTALPHFWSQTTKANPKKCFVYFLNFILKLSYYQTRSSPDIPERTNGSKHDSVSPLWSTCD